MRWVTCLVLSVFLVSCYRTHYVNFSPQNPDRAPAATAPAPVKKGNAWRSFFLYGWVPGKITIDARDTCHGAENVNSVKTRRTFLEGLVAAVAGFYVNIYSPWDGAVYCRQAPEW